MGGTLAHYRRACFLVSPDRECREFVGPNDVGRIGRSRHKRGSRGDAPPVGVVRRSRDQGLA